MSSESLPEPIRQLEAALVNKAPIFQRAVAERVRESGAPWIERCADEMTTYFAGDTEAIDRAAGGYGKFSVEAMRLQKRFDRTLAYDQVSYAEAAANVYHNKEYMQDIYLPALLLSHYLWPHHFKQLLWVYEHVYPRFDAAGAETFCDVGIGTGFYSKETLLAVPGIRGWGFDISDASIEHTEKLLRQWQLSDRYTLCKQEVHDLLGSGFDACVCVELLEHLEDPTAFLRDLRAALKDGAPGLLTAALDAPNRDHIYLYRSNDEVRAQIEIAGFKVIKEACFEAYETGSADETSPKAACFLVEVI